MSGFLRRYTELPYLIDYLCTKELALPSPKSWDDKNDTYYIEKYARAAGFQSTYALCLTEASETYHHWKIFSQGSGGACIEFNKDSLLKYVLRYEGLRAEPVRYKTLKELRALPPKVDELPFLKRSAFGDEIEFRLFVANTAPQGKPVRVHVPLVAVNRVVLSPWLPAAVADEVKATLKSIEGSKTLKVYKSSLVENEGWKRLAQSGA